jgi:type II secretory ATPase GspE/PulE/Tfp pilus assembly ATPase PilB-like protein
MLHDLTILPKSLANSVVSAVKVMSNLNITERRAPQDGKTNLWVDKADVDIRVVSSPAATGEKVSMRLLDSRMIFVDSTKLGVEGENLERFERAIRKPHGLILMTGPAGSGKTTTIYVALNTINTGEKNIITIEDPIEYQIKGINQMQVNPAANFTFATGLRSILRQDPDVILVGEIRDKETAEVAVEAAVTGHLIFTTLHTIDTASAFTRLLDLGAEASRFAAAIVAVIAQRLLRLNCTECKKAYKPKKEILEQLGFPPTSKDFTFMHGTGCESCFHTGFRGRVGIFEIFVPDESMKEILETNVTSSVIRELARKKGMRTLREEGIKKVVQGQTTPEEVLRIIS